MSSPISSKPFFNSSNKDQYGKFPLQSWVGKVVSYDAQKEQIEKGTDIPEKLFGLYSGFKTKISK